jgi:hypothetical protein
LFDQDIPSKDCDDRVISSVPTWRPTAKPSPGPMTSIPTQVIVPTPAPTNRPSVGGATKMPTVPQSGCYLSEQTKAPPSSVPSIVPTALPIGVTVAVSTAPSVKPSVDTFSAGPTKFPSLPPVPLAVTNNPVRVSSFHFPLFIFSSKFVYFSLFRFPRWSLRPPPVWRILRCRCPQRSRPLALQPVIRPHP